MRTEITNVVSHYKGVNADMKMWISARAYFFYFIASSGLTNNEPRNSEQH